MTHPLPPLPYPCGALEPTIDELTMRGWDGRPHWGKRSFLSAAALAPRFPSWADFAAIRERLDPEGRFVNAWMRQALL